MTHEILQSNNPTPSTLVPSPRGETGPLPCEFQVACLDHLLRLEKQLSTLRSRKSPAGRTEVIEVARLLLLEMVEFAQANLSNDEFEAVRVPAARVHELTSAVAHRMEKSSWNMLKILSPNASAEAELNADYSNLCQEYCAMMADFFVHCVKKFTGTDAEKKTFLQCAESLILEFGRCW